MQFLKRLTPMVSPLQNSAANTIYVDKDDNLIKVGTGNSGTTERSVVDSANATLDATTLLKFGGTTSSFPALKRSTTELQVRLADDSANTGIRALYLSINGAGQLGSASDGVWTMTDSAGTSFGRLQFGGTTSSFPSLKRATTNLQCRLADDSGDAGFTAAAIGVAAAVPAAGTIDAAGSVRAASATATPAGGTAGVALLVGSSSVGVYIGTGAPSVSAAKGSLYCRTDATTTTTRLYINTDGGTTWTTFTTAA